MKSEIYIAAIQALHEVNKFDRNYIIIEAAKYIESQLLKLEKK